MTPVGFRTGRFDDISRPSWDGSDPRPLAWTAWYPACTDMPEREQFAGPSASPLFTIGKMAQAATLLPSQQLYPLVMLSHGTGGNALHQGWLGRRLAERGFVAIGIDHHGNTDTEPARAEGFLCWWERARDITVLLNHLETFGEFAGRVDMERIFVAGFSLGACAAAALLGAITETSRFQRTEKSRDFARGVPEFHNLADYLPHLLENSAVFRESWARMSDNYRDARVKAALMLAPGRGLLGFNEDSLAAIDVPTHIIVGDTDAVLPAARWLHERLRGSLLDVQTPEVGHYVFLPEATEHGRRTNPAVCKDATGVNRRTIHDHVADAAVALFQ